MAKWAVFDIDGTLIPGSSMERLLVKRALKERFLPRKNAGWFFLNAAARFVTGGYTAAVRANKTYLRGLRPETVKEYAKDVFPNLIMPEISRNGIETIEILKKENYRIMLLSGSPRFLVEILGSYLSIETCFGSETEIRNGRFTGRIAGDHIFGKGKKRLLLEQKDALQIDFAHSAAYGNHHSDFLHLAMFGQPVAVNPDAKLRAMAEQSGLRAEDWTNK